MDFTLEYRIVLKCSLVNQQKQKCQISSSSSLLNVRICLFLKFHCELNISVSVGWSDKTSCFGLWEIGNIFHNFTAFYSVNGYNYIILNNNKETN